MPVDPHEFTTLLARVGAGDAEAGRQLYELYGGHVLNAVRRRLPSQMRSRFDSRDFCQDVWASVFAARTSAISRASFR